MEQKGKDLGIKRPGEDLDKHGEKTIKFSTEDLPIGISSIVDMLSTPYYVDKTEHAYELLHGISKYIFLSRPRRFGKSLFVSTLEEIAKGNKELFKNCWIGQSNYDWKKYPVIRLNFSDLSNETTKELKDDLKKSLYNIANHYNVASKISNPIGDDSVQSYFISLIERLIILGNGYEKQVVVLIDEYDTPFINVEDDNIKKGNLKVVRDFLTVLKGLSDHIKLEFVTGVSAYCFKEFQSGPNNLDDITLDPNYATVAGYREEDLLQEQSLYKQRINDLATKKKLIPEAIISNMRSMYNGYKFYTDDDTVSVYNPWSTLKFLKNGDLDNYWYESSTPTFLIRKANNIDSFDIDFNEPIIVKKSDLIQPNEHNLSMEGALFQAGYLTIDKYQNKLEEGKLRRPQDPILLKFPNEEVEDSFYNSLLDEFKLISKLKGASYKKNIESTLSRADVDGFIEDVIKPFFSEIPYNLSYQKQNQNEAYYHTALHCLLQGAGLHSQSECPTNKGRIDIVVNSIANITYIFELKHGNQSADIALNQIKSSKYRSKFIGKDKNIALVGINFSSDERNISDYKYEFCDSQGNAITINDIIAKQKTKQSRNIRSRG
ncbi:AAA family ATPase [Cardinium endosymbiont of Tipula unca]|uniref:AAA family ATPase n=1 Tax=Cardinium endosymbiont of Tipula unca TaxID=3066216 RepID=UPI0030CB2C9C